MSAPDVRPRPEPAATTTATPTAQGRDERGRASTPLRVVIAVLTYRRPADLAAVLPMLLEQIASLAGRGEILVVDNDPAAGAASSVRDLTPGRVRYAHEPTPGIAAARNRALDEAGDADLLVFIDDDERPEPGWLDALLATHAAEGAACVVGPVVSRYEVEPDPWITAGRFFVRRRLPTGTVLDVAATNNLLIDLAQLRRLGVRFDERYGLTGGSDTLFTRALAARGARMVWCDEAVVIDVVPAARLTRRWVLQRAYRSGNAWSRISLELATTPGRALLERLRGTLRGGVRLAGGAARWCVGAVTGHTGQRARGLRTIMRGAGLVSGCWGAQYAEYRRSS